MPGQNGASEPPRALSEIIAPTFSTGWDVAETPSRCRPASGGGEGGGLVGVRAGAQVVLFLLGVAAEVLPRAAPGGSAAALP